MGEQISKNSHRMAVEGADPYVVYERIELKPYYLLIATLRNAFVFYLF